jgi:hypothetical protein
MEPLLLLEKEGGGIREKNLQKIDSMNQALHLFFISLLFSQESYLRSDIIAGPSGFR